MSCQLACANGQAIIVPKETKPSGIFRQRDQQYVIGPGHQRQVHKHARPVPFLKRLHSSQSVGGFFPFSLSRFLQSLPRAQLRNATGVSFVPKGDKAERATVPMPPRRLALQDIGAANNRVGGLFHFLFQFCGVGTLSKPPTMD